MSAPVPVLQFVRLCDCRCGQPTLVALRGDSGKGWVKGQPKRHVGRHRSGNIDTLSVKLDNRYVIRENGCWEWLGKRSAYGYGQVTVAGVQTMAHRVSWIQANGPIPKGLVIDHVCHSRDDSCAGGRTCPHRRCINPGHLEPVTNTENLRRGSRVILTPEAVIDIRTSGADYKDMVEKYGISKSQVHYVRAGRFWSDVA